ncbi:hypothetical protein P4233_16775 [Pseudomonas aeruginosa]|nr:hypothetical protein [Pseudomonas aeruginosa]
MPLVGITALACATATSTRASRPTYELSRGTAGLDNGDVEEAAHE